MPSGDTAPDGYVAMMKGKDRISMSVAVEAGKQAQ